MSIYIGGLDMRLDECGRMLISIHQDGSVYWSECGMGYDRVEGAIASELPQHGDLIDRDEYLRSEKPRGIADGFWKESHIYKSVMAQKAIIPADRQCKR